MNIKRKGENHCTIEHVSTYPTAYIEKQKNHLLGNIKLSPQDFNDESHFSNPAERKRFYLKASLNGIQVSGAFVIDSYYAKFRLDSSIDLSSLEQLDIEISDYFFYEFLYQHPTYRLRLLQEVGPKLTLEEFEKRTLNNKTR